STVEERRNNRKKGLESFNQWWNQLTIEQRQQVLSTDGSKKRRKVDNSVGAIAAGSTTPAKPLQVATLMDSYSDQLQSPDISMQSETPMKSTAKLNSRHDSPSAGSLKSPNYKDVLAEAKRQLKEEQKREREQRAEEKRVQK